MIPIFCPWTISSPAQSSHVAEKMVLLPLGHSTPEKLLQQHKVKKEVRSPLLDDPLCLRPTSFCSQINSNVLAFYLQLDSTVYSQTTKNSDVRLFPFIWDLHLDIIWAEIVQCARLIIILPRHSLKLHDCPRVNNSGQIKCSGGCMVRRLWLGFLDMPFN